MGKPYKYPTRVEVTESDKRFTAVKSFIVQAPGNSIHQVKLIFAPMSKLNPLKPFFSCKLQKDRQTLMNRQEMDGQTNVQADRQTNGWTYRRTETNGQTDGHMDRYTVKQLDRY